MMKFKGTENYIATQELQIAVNAAVTLQKPLLIKGEPGTGKTMLAYEVAKALGKKLYTWHIKSTSTAMQGLYEYDAVSRLRDSQLNEGDINDMEHYIKKGKLWEAFDAEEQVVLLIDEIDKADIEFPNDLLHELDKMEFYCFELKRTISAKYRPIVIITSNNEKELPDAFLRRCFFHFITFPNKETMQKIVEVHFPNLENEMLQQAMSLFFGIRDVKALKKKPSTSELVDWIKLLIAGGVSADLLGDFKTNTEIPPYIGSLLKTEQDLSLYEGLRNGLRRY